MRKAMSRRRFKELHKKYGTTKAEDGEVGVIPWNELTKAQKKEQQEIANGTKIRID